MTITRKQRTQLGRLLRAEDYSQAIEVARQYAVGAANEDDLTAAAAAAAAAAHFTGVASYFAAVAAWAAVAWAAVAYDAAARVAVAAWAADAADDRTTQWVMLVDRMCGGGQ
ncbi:MAG: hypothetical protein AAFR47_21065 [Pseudomonadota bacterium]